MVSLSIKYSLFLRLPLKPNSKVENNQFLSFLSDPSQITYILPLAMFKNKGGTFSSKKG